MYLCSLYFDSNHKRHRIICGVTKLSAFFRLDLCLKELHTVMLRPALSLKYSTSVITNNNVFWFYSLHLHPCTVHINYFKQHKTCHYLLFTLQITHPFRYTYKMNRACRIQSVNCQQFTLCSPHT